MIRFTCPGCRSTLNAKDELAGQRRRCPKCGQAVEIPSPRSEGLITATPEPSLAEGAAPDTAEPAAGAAPLVHDLRDDALPRFKPPEEIVRSNIYLICDKVRVFATWRNDGQGWVLKTKMGALSAKRNAEQIPAHGDYTLVELIFEDAEEGRRLGGICVYELPKRWALPALARSDSAILAKVVGPGRLIREQKLAVRRYLEEQFMPEIWHENREVVDYLSNDDFVSPGTVRHSEEPSG